MTVWPSASSFPRMASPPPGYLGLICPSLLSVRQYGVIRLRPCRAISSAALAAIHEKMPVVIGQAKSVLCFLANAVRSSLMMVSLPLGTFLISASTSSGARMTNRPSPLSPYLDKSLESQSLAVQLTPILFTAMTAKACLKTPKKQFKLPQKTLASNRFLANFSPS